MSRKQSLFTLGAVVTLLILALIIQAFQTAEPVDLDSATGQEISAALFAAFYVLDQAAINLDCSHYPEVFIDTSDFPVREEEHKVFIESFLGPGTSTNAGYLTAMTAKCVQTVRVVPVKKSFLAAAEAENRSLTDEEKEELDRLNYGFPLPGLFGEKGDWAPSPEERIDIQSILLYPDGKRAVVRFDDHAALQEAVLVKMDDRWYVASIIALNVHY